MPLTSASSCATRVADTGPPSSLRVRNLALVPLLGLKKNRFAMDAPPAMGWSSYTFFIGFHNDPRFRRMAAVFVASGLRNAGYTILRIDGVWLGNDRQLR